MFQEDMLSGGTESDYSMEKNSLTHSSMPVLNQSNNRSTTVNTGSTASPNSDQVHLCVWLSVCVSHSLSCVYNTARSPPSVILCVCVWVIAVRI